MVLIYIIYNCYNCLNINSTETYPNFQHDHYAGPYNPDQFTQQNTYNDQHKRDPYREDSYDKKQIAKKCHHIVINLINAKRYFF